jgi:hypothetical protein
MDTAKSLPKSLWPCGAEVRGRQDDHPMGTSTAELLHWMATQAEGSRPSRLTHTVTLKLRESELAMWLERTRDALSVED